MFGLCREQGGQRYLVTSLMTKLSVRTASSARGAAIVVARNQLLRTIDVMLQAPGLLHPLSRQEQDDFYVIPAHSF